MLAIAHKLLDQIGMPNSTVMTRLFAQLQGTDTEGGRQACEAMRREADTHLAFSEPILCRPHFDDSLITQLYDCCVERPQRLVRFHYASASSPEVPERVVLPLGLIFNGAWYLVAHDVRKTPPERVYALDRMSRLKPDPFTVNQASIDFDMQTYMAAAWRLIIGDRQPRKVLLRIPRRFLGLEKHHSQVLEAEDGEWLRMAYYVSSPDEMIPFILSLGAQAEVLEPPSLREAVQAQLTQAAARYMAPQGQA
jgi:hypothetical protein